MAPQQSYPGKRTLRRRRRRNSDCPRCRSQEEQDAIPGGGHESLGHAGFSAQAKGTCLPLRQRRKLWENREGETTEYFMKLSTIILAVVSVALAIALISVHYHRTSQVDQIRAENLRLSNQLTEARGSLAESGKLAEVLQTDLAKRNEVLTGLSND